MNAEMMIDEVLEIVDDPSFDREDDALKYLNLAQTKVAQIFVLPGLSDGHDTVQSVVDAYKTDLPADYMKMLYAAMVNNSPVGVCKGFQDLYSRYYGLTTQAGTVDAVAVHAGSLLYQRVPAVATTIELFYYRKPTPMEDKLTSFPDGLGNLEDLIDPYSQALVHFAASNLFSKMEDGMEGPKVNTKTHLDFHNGYMEDLDTSGVLSKRPFPDPPLVQVNY